MSKTFNFLSNMKQVARILTNKAVLTVASTLLATGEMEQPYLIGPHNSPKSIDMFEDAEIIELQKHLKEQNNN